MICLDAWCGGAVEDGYCVQCGLAGGSAPASRPAEPNRANATAASTRTSTSTVRRQRLGLGLVEMPLVQAVDPATAVMADPTVPERRRYCGRCDQPVGRGRDGQPGRIEGYCRSCGSRFSFKARLAPGDVVGGQYVVAGCLAHGGLGWIYLARDRKVSDRWVVLKGLLDTNDDDAVAAALAERRFLAEVEHPNIVKIHNFVEHGTDGYIVMEYVNGVSLRGVLEARRAANGDRVDPLPIEQAIACCLEILPALGHLHELGLAFCDFKPDNVIQTGTSLKLIDLGGVYRMNEETGPIYGTVGYQAPEIAETGPTVASDLFTVGRTLAVLSTDFPTYQTTHRFDLPARATVALYTRFESLHAFLLRATAADPGDRFASAEEMAGQLAGVLREIVATTTGSAVPLASTRFTPPGRAATAPDWRALPIPLLDSDDPQAALVVSLAGAVPADVVRQLEPQRGLSVEVDLWYARALIEEGHLDAAREVLDPILATAPGEWRARWYAAIADVAADRADRAAAGFAAVYHHLPGELAPKLALGMVGESTGSADAVRWYEIVARTDRGYTSAAFGLGRCLAAQGRLVHAAAAYAQVPDTSSDHVEARIAEARLLLAAASTSARPLAEVGRAADIVQRTVLTPETRARLTVEVFETAVTVAGADSASTTVLGHQATERDLRLGLEAALRDLARQCTRRAERVALVERANRQRPRSLR